MLTMALPIALVGMLDARGAGADRLRAGRVLLLAAAISTYRKSALIGPRSRSA